MKIGTMVVLAGVSAQALSDARMQEPQQPAPIFRTGVDLVRVDVSVTGRNNKAVGDLTASDFEIKEDGVLQRIETTQFVRLDGTRTSDTDESLDIRSPEHAAIEAAREDVRLFAIFLDDYHVDKDQSVTLRVRAALKDFVRQFGSNDLIAVMDPLTPLSHLRFTRSRDELLARMDRFEGRLYQVMPVRSVLEEAQLTQRNIWELRGGVTLSALEALVTYLGGLREGRKSVLFVSQGPTMTSLDANEERLSAVVRAANRGNVTIHAFDPRPLGSVAVGGAASIARLTHETGGRAIVNTNEPFRRLTQTLADASAYYLLGYAPARIAADGKFHRIEVTVRRRGLRVLARRGYWAPTEAERNHAGPTPAEPALVEGGSRRAPTSQHRLGDPLLRIALAALVEPKAGREVEVWIGASRGSNRGTRMTVSWEPSGRTTKTASARLEIELLKADRTTPRARSRPVASETTIVDAFGIATFELEPGASVVFRFTAKTDEGVVLDRWDHRVTVPSLTGAPLALSTPRFLRARSAFEARALDAGRDPNPAASRRFRSSDRVLVDVNCYVGSGNVPTASAWLLNARGEPLLDLDLPPLTSDRARVTLPLSNLAPGTYILRFEVRLGEHRIEQQTAFVVVP